MSLIRRYLTGFRGADELQPGLFEKDDGTSWYRKPDGTEAEIGSGGFLSALDSNQYAIVACVLRNDGSGWYALTDDTNHHHINVDSVSNDTNLITIDYTSLGFSEVVTVIAVPDETLAQYGFDMGSSVTPTTTQIKIGQQRTLAADIGWNGSAFVVNNQNADPSGNFTIGSYTTGDLHISHDDVGASSKQNIAITGRSDTYHCALSQGNGPGQTDFFVSFYTFGGVKQTVGATNMRFYVQRNVSQHVNPNNITTVKYPNSNLWFLGIFKR